MKKIIYIFICTFILLVSLVSASIDLPNGYKLDCTKNYDEYNICDTFEDSSLNTSIWTVNDNEGHTYGEGAGYLHQYGGNTWDTNDFIYAVYIFDTGEPFSFIIDYEVNDTGASDWFYYGFDADKTWGPDDLHGAVDSDPNMRIWGTTTSYHPVVYTNYTIIGNATGTSGDATIYKNGSSDNTQRNTDFADANYYLVLWGSSGTASIKVNYIASWNGSLADAPYIEVIVPVVSTVIHSPLDGTKNNTQLNPCYTSWVYGGDNATCSLYVNGTLKDSENIANNTESCNLIDSTMSALYNNFSIICNYTTTFNGTADRAYIYDTGIPTISFTYPSEDNITSFANGAGVTLNLSINFTDDFGLYYFNVTVPNATYYTNYTNLSDSPKWYVFNYSLPVTNMTNTSHVVKVKTCDSHTAAELKETPDINKGDSSISYVFEKATINIFTYDADVTTVESNRLYDRYSFDFIYRDEEASRVLYLSSDEPIIYLDRSSYNGHFIIGESYWVDFEPYDVDVSLVGDIYYITIKNPEKEMSFRSIGELNCNEKEVSFSLLGPTPPATGYSHDYMNQTGFFNVNELDTDTTSGVLLWFFVFFLLVGLIVFSEYTRIPAFACLTGLAGMFFAALIYGSISAIFGIFMMVIFFGYIIRGVGMALE